MSTAAIALAEARRDLTEDLIHLPAWDADKVRVKLDRLEAALRVQIADEFTRRGRTQDKFTWGEAALIARGEL
jgi:hypothetical protein